MKPILALMLLLTAAYGGTWPDSMASVLERGSNPEIRALLKSRQTNRPIESDFSDAVLALKNRSPNSNHTWLLKRHFERPIAAALGESSFENFLLLLKTPSIPDEAKEVLLDAFLNKERQRCSSWKVEFVSFFGSLLASPAVTAPIKAIVLKEMGNQPAVSGDSAFPMYLNHSDSLLKTAAFMGLGNKIRLNRRTGAKEANRKIFNRLTQEGSASADVFVIRAIAQIGEDYGRNYLMPICAGSEERIRTVFLHDPDLKHQGFIKESAKMLRQSGDPKMASAMEYGIKNPETLIIQMLDGGAEDVVCGLILLRAYPHLLPSHSSRIVALRKSGIPEIRDAAKALNPNPTDSEGSNETH